MSVNYHNSTVNSVSARLTSSRNEPRVALLWQSNLQHCGASTIELSRLILEVQRRSTVICLIQELVKVKIPYLNNTKCKSFVPWGNAWTAIICSQELNMWYRLHSVTGTPQPSSWKPSRWGDRYLFKRNRSNQLKFQRDMEDAGGIPLIWSKRVIDMVAKWINKYFTESLNRNYLLTKGLGNCKKASKWWSKELEVLQRKTRSEMEAFGAKKNRKIPSSLFHDKWNKFVEIKNNTWKRKEKEKYGRNIQVTLTRHKV